MKLDMDVSAQRSLLPIAAWCLAGSVLFVRGAVAAVSQPPPADLLCIKSALAQVETGAMQEGPCAADRARGRHREVSRYHVLPQLWHQQTRSRDYANPALAWDVARTILTERITWFRARTRREPSAFDLYVMWNAPGHYQAVGFRPRRVRRAIADRATRFANLVVAANRHRSQMVTRDVKTAAKTPSLSLAAVPNNTRQLQTFN